MASKSGLDADKGAELEETLDSVESLLERTKVLYEQYFLGIQKQAPTQLHHDIDRKLRDLSQIQIRNTAMRYRLATVQQKFGSYNTYWRRTVRQIENGTYARNLSRIGRQAARTGEAIPEEILAAMPKRMREQVARDRLAVEAVQRRRDGVAVTGNAEGGSDPASRRGLPASDDFELDIDETALDEVAQIYSPSPKTVHHLSDDDDEVDVDALFAAITDDGASSVSAVAPVRSAAPAASVPQTRAATDVGLGDQLLVRRPMPATPTRHSTSVATPPPAAQPPAAPMRPVAPGTPAPMRRPLPPGAAATTGRMPTQVASPAPPAAGVVSRTARGLDGGMDGGLGGTPRSAPPAAAAPTIPAASPAPARPPTPPVAPPASAPIASSVARPSRPVLGQPAATVPIAPQPSPTITGVTSQRVRPPGAVPPVGSNGVGPMVRPSGAALRAATPPPRPMPAIPVKPAIPTIPAPPAPVPAAALGTPAPVPTAVRPGSSPGRRPLPAGVTEADVSTLYDQYVKARSSVGETSDARTYDRLVRTIEQQAPKIMEEHRAKGVEFQVVVKDNQVVLRAKPKP